MPSSKRSREPAAPDVGGKVLEVRRRRASCWSTMPSQPSHFASSVSVHSDASPAHRRRTLPSLAPILERRLDFLVERLRQLPAHRVELGAEHGAALALDRGVELVGGIGEEPHPVLDELCA